MYNWITFYFKLVLPRKKRNYIYTIPHYFTNLSSRLTSIHCFISRSLMCLYWIRLLPLTNMLNFPCFCRDKQLKRSTNNTNKFLNILLIFILHLFIVRWCMESLTITVIGRIISDTIFRFFRMIFDWNGWLILFN